MKIKFEDLNVDISAKPAEIALKVTVFPGVELADNVTVINTPKKTLDRIQKAKIKMFKFISILLLVVSIGCRTDVPHESVVYETDPDVQALHENLTDLLSKVGKEHRYRCGDVVHLGHVPRKLKASVYNENGDAPDANEWVYHIYNRREDLNGVIYCEHGYPGSKPAISAGMPPSVGLGKIRILATTTSKVMGFVKGQSFAKITTEEFTRLSTLFRTSQIGKNSYEIHGWERMLQRNITWKQIQRIRKSPQYIKETATTIIARGKSGREVVFEKIKQFGKRRPPKKGDIEIADDALVISTW